jgi:two-component system, LytTR family, sensor kinase
MLHPFLQGRSRIITHISAWTLVGLLFFMAISGLRTSQESLMRTGVNLFFMTGLFYLNARVMIDRFFEKKRYGILLILSLLIITFAAFLRAWIEIHWFGGSLFTTVGPPDTSGMKMFWAYFISFVLLMLFSTMYQLVENRNQLQLQHSVLEAKHHEAQLNFLKAQINPHFLFNTLHNIYAAAMVRHPKTPDMVLRLSDLLRYVTYDGQHNKVHLQKEIDHIKGYMDLYNWKAPEPLPVTLEIEGATDQIQIEPLLLLPLVENAYKHSNVEDDTATGTYIRIHLNAYAGERLEFQVGNTFDPANQQKDDVGGVGLENVRRRLELHYPGRGTLITKAGHGIYEITLSVDF